MVHNGGRYRRQVREIAQVLKTFQKHHEGKIVLIYSREISGKINFFRSRCEEFLKFPIGQLPTKTG